MEKDMENDMEHIAIEGLCRDFMGECKRKWTTLLQPHLTWGPRLKEIPTPLHEDAARGRTIAGCYGELISLCVFAALFGHNSTS